LLMGEEPLLSDVKAFPTFIHVEVLRIIMKTPRKNGGTVQTG